MSSDLREHEVRGFLERMAREMPTPLEVPPAALRQARGRLARTAIAALVAASLAVVGSLSGIRELLRAGPSRPADAQAPIVAIPVDHGARFVAVGEGGVWLTGGDTVSRVDLSTNEVVASFPGQWGRFEPKADVRPIVVGEGSVWVFGSSGEIVRIDPATNEVVATIQAGRYWALANGAGSVWATTHGSGTILRIDPATNAVTNLQAPRSVVHGVAVLDATVWIVAEKSDFGGGELFGVDPASGEVVSHISVSVYDLVTAGYGSLWTIQGSYRPGYPWIVRIDPSTRSIVKRIYVGSESRFTTEVAVGEDAVWVAFTTPSGEGRVLRIDPETNAVVGELHLGTPAKGIAAGEGAVWVTDGLGTLYRIDPAAVTGH